MGSIWLSKKAFLYFGGAAIILIGGLIVTLAPYNYFLYSLSENQHRPWTQKDPAGGFYPALEVSVSLRPANDTTYVYLDLVFQNNATDEITFVNMSLTTENQLVGPDTIIYEYSENIDLPIGEYTIWFDRVEGAGLIDLGLQQASDARLWIVTGGSMNIIGIIMGILGYLVPGTFLPSDNDTIVEWGYDEEESSQ